MSLTSGRRIAAFKPSKRTGLSTDDAEALAATALAALTEEPPHLARFMRETGIDPDDLRAAIGTRELLVAVLEHVISDEPLLLVLATRANVKPEAVIEALGVLQKPALGSA